MSDRTKSRTLGVDPGGTTGWSNGANFGELPSTEFLHWLNQHVNEYDRVAVERFMTRKMTPDSEATLELIGAIKWIVLKAGVQLGLVNASARYRAMSSVSEHVKGRHARDAEAVRVWDLQYGNWG